MNSAPHLDQKLLGRRKAMVTGMIGLTVLVLFGFTIGAWRFLQDMGDYLEEELGTRLHAVATLTSGIVEFGDFTYDIESDRLPLVMPELTKILRDVHDENQLQGVYLVDADYGVIAGSPGLFRPGERLSFLEEDSVWVNRALTGIAAVAPMQVVAGNRFKSAYAPIRGPLNDVLGVVVVQASADFFDLLGVFQRGLIFGGLVALTLALLFSIFLFWAISLLIKTHESLRKSERLAAMGQMAATVAHEIRNPLGIIKGTADVLKSKYASSEDEDELFDYIPSEVRRLNRLVSDFLTFARDRELEKRATDLRGSVDRSLTSLADEMSAANVTLERDYDDIRAVPHDEDAINQLILNFTLNSIQAMNGGGTLRVLLKNDSRKRKRVVRLEIVDTGCGFEVDQNLIFEPFYTTKTAGSGLGLAICKRLVDKHNGWIDVQSAENQGTKMRVFLPV